MAWPMPATMLTTHIVDDLLAEWERRGRAPLRVGYSRDGSRADYERADVRFMVPDPHATPEAFRGDDWPQRIFQNAALRAVERQYR